MKHSLTTIEGRREWVITPEPNVYIVCLEIPPQHRAAVLGNALAAITIQVINGGHAIGVRKVATVLESQEPGVEVEPPAGPGHRYSPALEALLQDDGIVTRMNNLCHEFVADVGGHEVMDEYYAQVCPERLIHNLLAEILGE